MRNAFTLAELLVSIAVVVILVLLAWPAFTTSVPIKKAQMAAVLGNARYIYFAAETINADNKTKDRPDIWPNTSGANSSVTAFLNELGLVKVEAKKLLSAPGIVVTVEGEPGNLTFQCEPNPALRFYAVGDRPDDGNQVFISSFNIKCTPRTLTIDKEAVPFGGYGGVIFRRDGSGMFKRARLLIDQKVQDSISKDQAEELRWR